MASKRRANGRRAVVAPAVAAYREARHNYEAFARKLVTLVGELVTGRGINVHAVESRVKSVDSFEAKLRRPGKNYTDPLEEIDDLCGIRVIAYYADDVDEIVKILQSQFAVDPSRSTDHTVPAAFDRFGYRSIHLVLTLASDRNELAEWRPFADFRAEVQVRTVLQHAWAAISHALEYKQETDVPAGLRRRLSRLSGLLELADEEFAGLRVAHTERVQSLSSPRAISGAELDLVSFRSWRDTAKLASTVDGIAEEAGFTVSYGDHSSEVVSLCQAVGIRSVEQLEESLMNVLPQLPRFFKRLVRPRQWEIDTDFAVLLAVVLAHWTSVPAAYFDTEWSASVVEIIANSVRDVKRLKESPNWGVV